MSALPDIPSKRYFTIGEVGDLCGVKPHVLRYWEQEFEQLKPIKRRGNRRYYQHHEVEMVRRIRELLYEHGYTISGARNQLQHIPHSKPSTEDLQHFTFSPATADTTHKADTASGPDTEFNLTDAPDNTGSATPAQSAPSVDWNSIGRLRRELKEISQLLVA